MILIQPGLQAASTSRAAQEAAAAAAASACPFYGNIKHEPGLDDALEARSDGAHDEVARCESLQAAIDLNLSLDVSMHRALRASMVQLQSECLRLGPLYRLHLARDYGRLAAAYGQFEEADAKLNEALRRAQAMAQARWQIEILLDLGNLYMDMAQLPRARRHLREAERLWKSSRGKTTCPARLRKDLQSARGFLSIRAGKIDEGCAVIADAGYPVERATCAALQHRPKALRHELEQADVFSQKTTLRWARRNLLMGMAFELDGRRQEAWTCYRHAINDIESQRQDLDPSDRAGLLDSWFRPFGMLEPHERLLRLMAPDDPMEALRGSERIKERNHLGQPFQYGQKGGLEHLRKQELTLISESIKTLRADEIVLEYQVLEKETLLFLLGRQRPVQAISIPISRSELSRQVASYRHSLCDSVPDAFREAAGRRLYSLLLRPALSSLGEVGKLRLTVIPDKFLALLPFEALVPDAPRPGHGPTPFFGDDHDIVYTPSLEARALSRKDGRREPLTLAGLSGAPPACKLGGARQASGERLIDMARACQGCAQNIVISLWNTPPVVSGKLTQRVLRHIRSGRTPSEALRLARAELRRDPRYAPPACWASFILIGD